MTSTVVNLSPREISEPYYGLRTQGLYRALPATADTFARESHIDELAYLAGVDPVDFRLSLLDDPRLAAVTQAAARRFGWWSAPCPAGRPALWVKGWLRCGAGIAVGLERGLRVATCAEVRPEVDVMLLDRPDLPSAAVGETPLIALAPAIANAVFAVTGCRPPTKGVRCRPSQ